MSSQAQISDQEIWKGKPWILPYVVIRTMFVAALAIAVIIVENLLGILYLPQLGLPSFAWTLIAFVLVWILAVFNLMILWVTHSYVLVKDSLEIKTGFLTTKTSMIAPTGFSDLEVIRSITSRLLNTGDIMIKTQSERDFTKKMLKVKDPIRVANLIRDVMARPIFKIDERGSEKKN